MTMVYEKSKGLTDVPFHYCPGCTHGVIHKLVAEVLVELGVLDDTIGVAPVGCSVLAYKYFNCDMQEAAHGRAPAVATGIKRVHPDKVVFSYQGDGDLASIDVVVFCPTTLVGQKTTTSPFGRDEAHCGKPIRMAELLATIDGAKFVERVSVDTPANIRKAKKAIKKAFECQIKGEGFAIVEVLSSCPTNWGFSPVKALQWLRDNMIPYYPLGNFRNFEEGK